MTPIRPRQDHRRTLFDRIAGIAARTVAAPISLVSSRHEKRLKVHGSHGIYVPEFDACWDADSILVKPQGMSFVKNVHQDPAMRGHPLLKIAPFMRTLVHIPASGFQPGKETAITILDPASKWPFGGTTSTILVELAMLVGDAMEAKADAELATGADGIELAGLSENPQKILDLPSQPGHNTAAKFLLKTLLKRTTLRNRKDVSYVTLRTWSKTIKEHQLGALQIVKLDPDPEFVKAVADEIAQHVRRFFGAPRIGCVVAVPCGHSRRDDCLSVQIARMVADILAVSYVAAFECAPLPGSSHPIKSQYFRAPKLVAELTGDTVLLVDDVATSGRHIETAVNVLREKVSHVTAIAWIGAN